MNDARIAIILTSYNRSKIISETIRSIQNQSEKRFRCFVIDDFSIDDTLKIVQNAIKDDPRFTLYEKNENDNKGLSASRNIGIKLSQSEGFEFINFFDDDDIMHPEKLEIQLKYLEQNPRAQLCICGSKNFQRIEEINWEEKNNVYENQDITLWDAYLTGKIKFVAQVPLFRYDFFKDYRFDEDLLYAEEWVLFVQQFYKEKPEFVYTDRVLFYRRKHAVSITSGGNRNFNVRKTSAIAGIKVFDFLVANGVNTKTSILHYTRYFLIYNYDSDLLRSIKKEIKLFFPEIMFRFKFSIIVHKFYRKFILRVLKY